MSSLSEYLKQLGLKDYNSTSTLNSIMDLAISEKAQSTYEPIGMVGSLQPNARKWGEERPGEYYPQVEGPGNPSWEKRNPKHGGLSDVKKTTGEYGGVNPDGTPSQQIGDEIAQYVPSRDSFQDRFGTEEELLPYGAMHQFAEQQVNPEHFRNTVRNMSGMDRQLASSGAWRTGHGQAERGRALDDAERQRRMGIGQYMDMQKNLFTDWYGQEMHSYMTGKDPSNFALNAAGLGEGYGDLGWTNTPGARPQQAQYNPLDMRDYFQSGGRGGYQTQPSNLYGNIQFPQQPQAQAQPQQEPLLQSQPVEMTQPWTPEY